MKASDRRRETHTMPPKTFHRTRVPDCFEQAFARAMAVPDGLVAPYATVHGYCARVLRGMKDTAAMTHAINAVKAALKGDIETSGKFAPCHDHNLDLTGLQLTTLEFVVIMTFVAVLTRWPWSDAQQRVGLQTWFAFELIKVKPQLCDAFDAFLAAYVNGDPPEPLGSWGAKAKRS